MDNQIANPDLVDALSRFLQFGPIGLAGLMLVLVVMALSFRNLNAATERLLKTFLYVGAVCFIAALFAQTLRGRYELSLEVLPNDLDGSVLPPPKTKINGKVIDDRFTYIISSDVRASIDVTRAFNMAKAATEELKQTSSVVQAQSTSLTSISSKASDLSQKLEELNRNIAQIPTLLTQSCPGGPHGIDPIHLDVVNGLLTSSMATLSDLKQSATSGLN